MIKIKKTYLIITLLLFLIEVLIALYVQDDYIRPYAGDLLVVILIYCFVKSFFDTPMFLTALGVLLFAYMVEILQYFNLVEHLGLAQSRLANIIIGNYFTWIDILAYTLGILIIIVVERSRAQGTGVTVKENQHFFI